MQTGKNIYSPPSVFVGSELTRGNIIVPARNLLTGKVASLLKPWQMGRTFFQGQSSRIFTLPFSVVGKKISAVRKLIRTNVYVFIYVYVFIGRVFYIQNCFNLILIDDNNTGMQFDQLSDISSIYI